MPQLSSYHYFDPNTQAYSPLFKLPGELGNQIWAYALGGRNLFFTQTPRHEAAVSKTLAPPRWKLENDFEPRKASEAKDFLGHNIDVSLRLTCKQAAAEGRKALYIDNHIFLDTTRVSLFDDVWNWPSLAQWPIDKARNITVPLLSAGKLENDHRLRLLGPYLSKPDCSITIVALVSANALSPKDPERWTAFNEMLENLAFPGLFKAHVQIQFFMEECVSFGPPINSGLLELFKMSREDSINSGAVVREYTFND